MNKYEVLGVVGEGAYGVVLRCRNKDSGTVVAVKKFKESEDDEIVKKTTLREVKVLRMLRHPNIVCLKEAFRRKGKLYLVFEYVDKNLLEVLEDNPDGLPFEAVRGYIHQLCRAIDWCHHNGVVHRDIKPENLLVNPATNELKLCDFGFARTIPPSSTHQQELTDYVATRWYRAPELLLGSTRYDPSVDIWAIGCIMGELVDGQPLFPGDSEIDQLYIVQRMLGPITEAHLQLFLKNPRFVGLKFPDMSRPETLQKRFVGKLGKRAMAFMRGALTMNPVDRLSSREAVCHSLFEGLFEDYVDRYPHLQQSRPQQQQQHHHHHQYQEEDDFQGCLAGGGAVRRGGCAQQQHSKDQRESSHDREIHGREQGDGGGGTRNPGGFDRHEASEDTERGWNRDQDREDWRRSGGGGGRSDQKLATQHTRNTTGESSHGGDDQNLACRPNPPSGGVPRLGSFARQSSQQPQRQLQQQHQQSGWEARSRALGGGGGRGGTYGHRRGSGSNGQSNATRHRDRPVGRDYGSKGMGFGGGAGRENRRTGGRGVRNGSDSKGRYMGEKGEGGYGGGEGREDRSACPTNGGQSVGGGGDGGGGADANYSSVDSGEPHPVISGLYQSSNHIGGGGSHCRLRENENPGSSPSVGVLYENDMGMGGGNYYGSFNAKASPHQHQTHHNNFYQQQQTHQQAPPFLHQHQHPAPSSREGHQHHCHHDESGNGTSRASPQLLPGFSGSRNLDGEDSERKGYGRDLSREGRDRASRDLRERDQYRDNPSYRDGGVGDGCRERSRGDYARNTSREANREIGGGGERRGPIPLKGLQAEPKASPRGEGKTTAGDSVNGMPSYLNGGGMGRSMATTGKASDRKPSGTRRWKSDGGAGGGQSIAEEKRQRAREIQAERERQRENEIRAFRDFSNHLASSSNKTAGIRDFGEEDIDFRKGAPKRAEHKAAAVSLDALRDPTLGPRSRGRDDPSSRRDYTAAAGGGIVGSSNASRRLFGPGIGEPESGANGCDNMNRKQGFQQGFGESGGIGSSQMSARYPPLEHIQNPPQPDPKAVAGMDKFPGPHPGAVAKPSAFAGYPISPLHMKRRGSSNPSAGGVGAIEEKLEAKRGLGVGIDAADARYLPQLRRSEGRYDAHHSSSGY